MSDPINNVDVAIGVVDGQVVAKWKDATNCIVFDAQNAFQVGEAFARAAHQARFPGEKLADESYIAQQIRARVTENIRVKAINRVALILPSLERQHKTPGYIAMTIVDAILREVM